MNSKAPHNASSKKFSNDIQKSTITSLFSLRLPKMKRLICIGFCFSLMAPIFSAYFAFQYRSSTIRQEVEAQIEEGIEEHDLVLLKFTHEETETLLRWEHSREFEFNQQMYDIVETEVFEDSIFYLVYWDIEETELKNGYKDLITGILGVEKNSSKHRILLKLGFRSIYFLEHKENLALLERSKRITFPKIGYDLLTQCYPPLSPPPRFG